MGEGRVGGEILNPQCQIRSTALESPAVQLSQCPVHALRVCVRNVH